MAAATKAVVAEAVDALRQQWISRALTGVLLALTVWLVISAAIPFFSSTEPVDLVQTQDIEALAAPGTQATESLAGRHLFGRSEAVDTLGFTQITTQTDLALSLRGVVAAEDPGSGLAIIADGRNGEGAYAVGSELPGGASLEAVLPDRAILNRNGRRETLMLDGAAPAGRGQPVVQSGSEASRAPQPAAMATPLTSNVPGARGFAININELAASYNLIPAPGGGFKINLGRDAKALAATGLHQGDIIRAANGATLDNPALVQQVLAEVLLGKPLSLTVERGGETVTVKPDLDAFRKRQ